MTTAPAHTHNYRSSGAPKWETNWRRCHHIPTTTHDVISGAHGRQTLSAAPADSQTARHQLMARAKNETRNSGPSTLAHGRDSSDT